MCLLQADVLYRCHSARSVTAYRGWQKPLRKWCGTDKATPSAVLAACNAMADLCFLQTVSCYRRDACKQKQRFRISFMAVYHTEPQTAAT
jgi:hypothetical protein